MLAPTDPGLASDVQVGPPDTSVEDEVRFALTSEAGLNDGFAVPLVNLALAPALHTAAEPGMPGWAVESLAVDVAWKLLARGLIGWATGYALGWLMFHLPDRAQLPRTTDGFTHGITVSPAMRWLDRRRGQPERS